jgi:hypothetical protein
VYSASDIKKWAAYQRSIGKNTVWKDPDHQDTTATGPINPIQTAYVVVPRNHRELLHKSTKVCVVATGKCITAVVREIGPRFGELSVGAMMKLKLDSHPSYGQYHNQISYTFSK